MLYQRESNYLYRTQTSSAGPKKRCNNYLSGRMSQNKCYLESNQYIILGSKGIPGGFRRGKHNSVSLPWLWKRVYLSMKGGLQKHSWTLWLITGIMSNIMRVCVCACAYIKSLYIARAPVRHRYRLLSSNNKNQYCNIFYYWKMVSWNCGLSNLAKCLWYIIITFCYICKLDVIDCFWINLSLGHKGKRQHISANI